MGKFKESFLYRGKFFKKSFLYKGNILRLFFLYKGKWGYEDGDGETARESLEGFGSPERDIGYPVLWSVIIHRDAISGLRVVILYKLTQTLRGCNLNCVKACS